MDESSAPDSTDGVDAVSAAQSLLPEMTLMPPTVSTPWRGLTKCDLSAQLSSDRVMPLPMVALDLPWHEIPVEDAEMIATMLRHAGVSTAALFCELGLSLGSPDADTGLDVGLNDDLGDDLGNDLSDVLDGVSEEETIGLRINLPILAERAAQQKAAEEAARRRQGVRITPYRCDRYGLELDDLQSTDVIDIRLFRHRHESGRFAYDSQQFRRWEPSSTAGEEEEADASPALYAAAGWPADVPDIPDLKKKIDQMRQLSLIPRDVESDATDVSLPALVFLSIEPYRVSQELPTLLQCQPDGVILRMDQMPPAHHRLIPGIIRQARQIMDHESMAGAPLWVAPPFASADDIAGCIALGANAVAIDCMIMPLFHALREHADQMADGDAWSRPEKPDVQQAVTETVSRLRNRVTGLAASCGLNSIWDLDQTWYATP